MHSAKIVFGLVYSFYNFAEAAGTNYLFLDMNRFLIFESVQFSDEARAQYIKNVQDFWNVVSRYIDVSGLHGGDVFVDVPENYIWVNLP